VSEHIKKPSSIQTERLLEHDPLIIAGRAFRSRLMVGTGKFPSAEALRAALHASGAQIVTVALRRVDFKKG
jgi:thiazole synthase